MSVCLSARITPKSRGRTSPVFYACCMWPCMAQSSSGGAALRYVNPVLWMTSSFHTMVLQRIMCIPKRRCSMTSITAEIPTKFCSTTIKSGSRPTELRTGGEVCYLRLPRFTKFVDRILFCMFTFFELNDCFHCVLTVD